MKTSVLRMARMSAYAALTVGVIVLTILLVAIGRGYIFNFRTGQVEGGGLILLSSAPEGAKIMINGQDISKNTPNRLGVRAGSYEIELSKPNFRTWRKSIPVVTSEVSWAQYPLLVPTVLPVLPVSDIPAVSSMSQSPDKKFMAIINSKPAQRITLLELGKNDVSVVYTLSTEQVAAGTSVESVVWANDGQHILITLRNKGTPSFIVMNALNPSEVNDLSHDFGTNLSGLEFSARNWRELYWLTPEGLRRLDLANRTLSAVLAENVQTFTSGQDAVYYVKTDGDRQLLMRLDRDNQTRVLARNLPISNYGLASLSFENKTVLALSDKINGHLRLFNTTSSEQSIANPYDHLPTADLLVSPDGRYLVMYKGAKFATYSLEFNRLHQFTLPSETYGPLSWFDNYHLMTNINGRLLLIEFDGANQEELFAAQAGLPAFSDDNRDKLYSISGDKLQVTDLRP